MDAHELACSCPGCGMTRAAPALLGIAAGLALTAGWVARVAWGIGHDRCGQSH